MDWKWSSLQMLRSKVEKLLLNSTIDKNSLEWDLDKNEIQTITCIMYSKSLHSLNTKKK